MKRILSVFVLMTVLCATSSATTIVSTFKCSTTEDENGSMVNGTMTFYSYLKEPKLQKNGYTSGYKTGSLNYLVDGNISFTDKMTYYDGQIEPGYEEGDDINSTVRHTQNVNFAGKKGISEFYAKGFFPSNRAISAGKKIRFENLTTIKYDPGNEPASKNESDSSDSYLRNYDASYIFVKADVGMGPTDGIHSTGSDGDYDFEYTSDVKNGVIEVRDSTGWTNETGARRVDWDQDAIMRGNFNITNDLYSESLFFPGAGLNDEWLPCCFDGTHPPVQNRDRSKVLQPDKLLPTKKLKPLNLSSLEYAGGTGRYTINSMSPGSFEREFDENFTCDENNCTGFECIYTYDEGEDTIGSVPQRELPKPEVSKLFASKVIFEVNGRETKPGIRPKINNSDTVTYEIEIYHNDHDIIARNVTVTDILPRGLVYVDGRSVLMYEMADGTEGEVPDFEPTEDEDNGTLTWNFNDANDINLTELRNGVSVFIDLEVIVGSEEAAFANEVKASGVSGNKTYESGVVGVSSFR